MWFTEGILQFLDDNKFPLTTVLTELDAARVYTNKNKLQVTFISDSLYFISSFVSQNISHLHLVVIHMLIHFILFHNTNAIISLRKKGEINKGCSPVLSKQC